ncbi:TPA: 2-keto-3-deoxygluconate permease [Morganella morganii]|nr:2-keto-3-deoxygluconate permease [Morganella morganii subsp. morganii]HDT1127435.1 2-keto-3-deoxygluconate permease [Morganella morganii subsp. morganii]HDU8608928.1 2-keto-3-deoxygluconate permease [Morganella morganii]
MNGLDHGLQFTVSVRIPFITGVGVGAFSPECRQFLCDADNLLLFVIGIFLRHHIRLLNISQQPVRGIMIHRHPCFTVLCLFLRNQPVILIAVAGF